MTVYLNKGSNMTIDSAVLGRVKNRRTRLPKTSIGNTTVAPPMFRGSAKPLL